MTARGAAAADAKEELRARQGHLAGKLAARRLDGLIVSAQANIRYLAGFTGSNGLLAIGQGAVVLFTDPRYGAQAAEQAGCRVRVVRRLIEGGLVPVLRRLGWKRIGFEPSRLPYSMYEKLRAGLPGTVRLVPTENLMEELRAVKSAEEIARIRRSAATALEAFARVSAMIRPGMKETEVAAELDYQMRRLGAEGPAFDTIVASGERSAWPHAGASSKALEAGEPVLIDMGARQDGYASDLTRMVALGRAPRRIAAMHRAVLEAQLAALEAVREGVSCGAVDRAARQVLRRHGLERYFVHSTGHGLGLEIHEPPRLGARERTRLRAGMVVTIEPGVYIPGVGGVRIEDTVVVTPNGAEILTDAPKELLVI